MALLAHLRFAKITWITSVHLLARTIVLPDTIFQERLQQQKFLELPISIYILHSLLQSLLFRVVFLHNHSSHSSLLYLKSVYTSTATWK